MVSRKKIGGAALVFGGLVLFGKETLLWAWNRVLDGISSGVEGGMSIAFFPWQNAIASLLTLSGLALVFWPTKAASKASKYDRLVTRAQYLVARLRKQREPQYIRHAIEPLTDVCRDGFSTMVMFAQCGFAIPEFNTTEAERIAVGMEHYFATIHPLIRDGHIKMAQEQAPRIAEAAQYVAASLNVETFVDYGL